MTDFQNFFVPICQNEGQSERLTQTPLWRKLDRLESQRWDGRQSNCTHKGQTSVSPWMDKDEDEVMIKNDY